VIPNFTATLLGNNAINTAVSGRVYRTAAPQSPAIPESPLIVWTIISGSPENYLQEAPDIDDARFQFDFYALAQSTARQLCEAAQAVLEPLGYIVMGPMESREEETLLWRWTFDLETWTSRA
jgi:hypothetical protein